MELVLRAFMNGVLEVASKEECRRGWTITRLSLSSFLHAWC